MNEKNTRRDHEKSNHMRHDLVFPSANRHAFLFISLRFLFSPGTPTGAFPWK
jgi:hypothetical protein